MKVDYDRLADGYDARYAADPLQALADALRRAANRSRPGRILEVGCGTGRWLREVQSSGAAVYGADASARMLARAIERCGPAALLAARANALPFRKHCFDLIYCVNALHHFDDPQAFVGHAAELLREQGILSVVGIDPRLIRSRYLYDYFDSAYAVDLQRYPSVGDLVGWMAAAGFQEIDYRIVERRVTSSAGREVFSDPFLKKESNSLLVLLSDEQYRAGLQRMEAAVAQAEQEGREIRFNVDMDFLMVEGRTVH